MALDGELDFGIGALKAELDEFRYQWNEQLDFNEWFDDVYILKNKDAGGHTTKELWELFNQYRDSLP